MTNMVVVIGGTQFDTDNKQQLIDFAKHANDIQLIELASVLQHSHSLWSFDAYMLNDIIEHLF